MKKNISGKYLDIGSVDKYKKSFELMYEYNRISLNDILEWFWDAWGVIAMGFEAFWDTPTGAGEVTRMFKDDVLHDKNLLNDVVNALSFAVMWVFKKRKWEKVQLPDGRWTEDLSEVVKMMEPLIETAAYIYTVFGDVFFDYVIERKARGLKPSRKKLKEILDSTVGDELLFKWLDMKNKEGAIVEMVDWIKEEWAAKRQKELD